MELFKICYIPPKNQTPEFCSIDWMGIYMWQTSHMADNGVKLFKLAIPSINLIGMCGKNVHDFGTAVVLILVCYGLEEFVLSEVDEQCLAVMLICNSSLKIMYVLIN